MDDLLRSFDNPLSISLHMRATHTGRRQPGRQPYPFVGSGCKGGSGEDDAHDAAHDIGAGRGQPAGAGDAPAPAARRRHLYPVRRRLPAGTRMGIRWPADRLQPRVPASGMVAADPRSPASPPVRERALQRGPVEGGSEGDGQGKGTTPDGKVRNRNVEVVFRPSSFAFLSDLRSASGFARTRGIFGSLMCVSVVLLPKIVCHCH